MLTENLFMPKIPFWVFIIIAVLYFTAVRVDTMDIDASEYAVISSGMVHSNNWLQVYDLGRDYLDKPPFLFWVSALSMKIFGENDLGYKLPSILLALWALYATYRLARLLYNENTARLAALLLATCQGMFLMVNDVRCDTILMSWVITAIWLIKEWDVTRKIKYLMLGFCAIGLGMMTKGPIALMVPVFCFISDWSLKREWRKFFHPAYLVGIIIIALLLLPMSIGLYQQFDLHPEKVVNGTNGVSGLRFFYWSQSFGRITGESPWKNNVDLSFLLVNMLWSFLPWVFLFVPALILNVYKLIAKKFRLGTGAEWVTTGGFLLAYLALGSSGYQLPHYIFVAFPLAAIVTAASIAGFLQDGQNKMLFKVIAPFFTVIGLLVLIVVLVLIVYVFPAGPGLWVAFGLCLTVWFYVLLKKGLPGKLFWVPVTAMIAANIFMMNYIYPTLLTYQVGTQAGKYIKQAGIKSKDFLFYKMRDPLNSLSFYAGEVLIGTDTIVNVTSQKYILTMDEGLADLKQRGDKFTVLKQGVLFKVSQLTPEFLNPETRNKAVKNYYLVQRTIVE